MVTQKNRRSTDPETLTNDRIAQLRAARKPTEGPSPPSPLETTIEKLWPKSEENPFLWDVFLNNLAGIETLLTAQGLTDEDSLTLLVTLQHAGQLRNSASAGAMREMRRVYEEAKENGSE